MQSNRSSRTPSQRSTTGRGSQMQAPLATHRVEPQFASSSGRPSQMQIEIYGQNDTEPPRSSRAPTSRYDTGRSSVRPQGGLSRINEDDSSYGGGTSRYVPTNSVAPSSRYDQAAPSIFVSPPSQSNRSTYTGSTSRRSVRDVPQSSAPMATHIVAPRTSGKSIIVYPGEPHHFGSSTDRSTGEILCTLCRCRTPGLHKDAYTMLSSPRGNDINGQPIDWQEAKRRMLDHYRRDQITHAEEVAAIPHVFDGPTAEHMLETERDLVEGCRRGYDIVVNVEQNMTDWFNEDGHAKPHITEEGLKTNRRF
ncbi:hypothetical protein FB567DRAFT_588074 [Paraphoma chrysanthemicola]|uniref:Uncharacterized protein n=1 Tax=Paraphoma chrysanthemicola TaxID=798071 RepID=A0A8K0RIN9_9PLEO|nr:hypothetical protein FB567DRAFT_588074 [Paraphoma chrysanthemicola]